MSRPTAHRYSLSEKRKILKYIIDHNAYHRVKGNVLWQGMETNFDNHTWQSLKEHFKKKLFPNLASSDLKLSDIEIDNFKQGYGGILQRRKHVRTATPFPTLYQSSGDGKSREDKNVTRVANMHVAKPNPGTSANPKDSNTTLAGPQNAEEGRVSPINLNKSLVCYDSDDSDETLVDSDEMNAALEC